MKWYDLNSRNKAQVDDVVIRYFTDQYVYCADQNLKYSATIYFKGKQRQRYDMLNSNYKSKVFHHPEWHMFVITLLKKNGLWKTGMDWATSLIPVQMGLLRFSDFARRRYYLKISITIIFLTAIWLPYSQLLAILKGTTLLTRYWSLRFFIYFDPKVIGSLVTRFGSKARPSV